MPRVRSRQWKSLLYNGYHNIRGSKTAESWLWTLNISSFILSSRVKIFWSLILVSGIKIFFSQYKLCVFKIFPKPIMLQILSVTDMHTVWMPCYSDEYPLLCCTIIKFQHLVFRTCNILKFNVPSCTIQPKQPYFYTRINWISSRRQPTRGGPTAWGLGEVLTTPSCKISMLRNRQNAYCRDKISIRR